MPDCWFGKEAEQFLASLSSKSQNIGKENLKKPATNPFPGDGGDKERLDLPTDPPVYRMHIGRSYTAFHHIDIEQKRVKIDMITTIEQAHNQDGR